MYERFHPFASTVEETLDHYDLTPKEKLAVLDAIPLECPWFSQILYMRTHHAAAQFINQRTKP